MKNAVLILGLVTFGFTTQAHAQDDFRCTDACAGLVLGLLSAVVLDGAVAVGGLVTAGGSSVKVAQGKPSKGWFTSSYALGGLNLTLAVLWATLAAGNRNDGFGYALAVTHGLIGAFGVTMPTIGFLRGERAGAPGVGVSPVVLEGRDVGGKPWAGVGAVVFGF